MADSNSEPDDAPSRADQAAMSIRRMLITGELIPGQRLVEGALGELLGVSRNTLREACRMLTNERLLERKPNVGVFVVVPTLASIIDIYRVRRLIECPALAQSLPRHPASRRMRLAVDSAIDFATAGDWLAVGTANMEFHSAIVALADSDHLDRLYGNLSAELRLAFSLLDDPEYLHEPYVERNLRVWELYDAGQGAEAAVILEEYLMQSERTVIAAYSRARFN